MEGKKETRHNENEHEKETGQEDEIAYADEMKSKKKNELLQFRRKVEEAIIGNYLLGKPGKNPSATQANPKTKEQLRDITIWGVPLLPSKGHAGTDVVLLKFLRARDFKVQDAFEMLRKTLRWRKEYKIDGILEEKLGSDLENITYFKSRDREGHPLCYVTYGALQDRELCKKAFGTEEKCRKFLRWNVKNMEKGIKKLSFSNGGRADSILYIVDLKNFQGPGMEEVCSINKKFMMLLADYYPEIIHKFIVINGPFWYYASHLLLLRSTSRRDQKNFVFASSGRVPKTLLKFIAPENLPVEYGGLKRENDEDFTPAEKASELIIRGTSITHIEFPVTEVGVTMVWDVTVVRGDVSYKEEFIPNDEGSYNILVQNRKKMGETVRNSFYISEPGRIVITIDNDTFKKKRVFYRSKTKPTNIPIYDFSSLAIAQFPKRSSAQVNERDGLDWI
ncbi:hypothetical protein CIPAW_03G264800 [Carya illinoinensis]|uniref:CRAL-TRIO domain-containing protein n=1 Tax=Carya illinoinensis TaxID=32201 RepID=A0A8T1R8M5_CARIL|nr:hypothetical protein CIPAW_03G264800 [Carya illinoinensis]